MPKGQPCEGGLLGGQFVIETSAGRSGFEPPEEPGVSSRDRAIDELRAQVEDLARQVAVLAGKPVQSARQAEVCSECHGPRV
jgi:hypothetical protein